jgi:hypothetical protein
VDTNRGAIAEETAPSAAGHGRSQGGSLGQGLSLAIRDDVPLDKRDVSYYSFHISTQGSPLAVLLPQGKGRVGQ